MQIVELRSGVRSLQQYRFDQRWWPGHRTRSRGHDLSDDLWSARLLFDAPDEIVAAHRAFFRGRGGDRDDGELPGVLRRFRGGRHRSRSTRQRLMRRSVELAAAARDEAGGDGRWVAASVGPYGAALANGEEYGGRYGLSVARAGASGIGRGWRSWPTREPTCWPSRRCPTSTRPRPWSAWSPARCACVVELHDRRPAHPRGPAAGGGVRCCGRCARDRRGRGELLRAERCAAGHRRSRAR